MSRFAIFCTFGFYFVLGVVAGCVASEWLHRRDVVVLPLPAIVGLPFAPRSAALLPQAYALPTP